MWLWIRAMRSGYVPDNRAMAIARNSFFFRIWGLVTETQLDQIANILIHQEIKEETKLEGVYGKANQPHHAIDLHLDGGYWKITLDPHWENL
jgi:hypothetical protein